MAIVTVSVHGLVEVARAVAKINPALPKAMRIALNEAAELVIGVALPEIPKRTGAAARSLRPRSTRSKVRVSAGGDDAPHYPWLDFGGRVGPDGSVFRPVLKEGRYIYPAYYEARDRGEFQRVLERALLPVLKQAGLEVD